MTAQQLKNSILQLAVQGKLVPQDPSDEPASILLEKIRAEKERLVKEGRLKRDKSSFPIADDEVPFELPDTWEWVRLKDLCIKIGSGSTPTGGKTVYKNHGVKFIRSQNVYDDGLRLDNVAYISEEVNQQKIGSYVYPNDILLNITGGSIGRCAIVPNDFDGANVNQHVMIIRLVDTAINRYIHSVLISSYIQNMIMGVQVGVSREGLSAAKLMDFLIPIPPHSEQIQILACIDALLPRIADYDAAEQKLTALNAKFPDQLKKSILQSAVQGKLVEQDPNDEPASVLLERIRAEKEQLIKNGKLKKEKPLLPITEDDIPFDVPDSWKWCRLGDLGRFVRGSGIKRNELVTTGVPCVRYGEIYTTYDIAMTDAVSFVGESLADACKPVKHGDLLMTLTGETKEDIGKTVAFLGKERTVIGGDLATFSHSVNPLWLSYMMNSPHAVQSKRMLGTGNIIVHISCDKLSSILIPLPPLAEQKRIVAKCEEMMVAVEGLGGNK